MDLPLLSAAAAAFAITLYVVLDGFDLGVGVLLLFAPREGVRDRMMASIAPTWDGNETWLVMAGVALLAAFPIAYGILVPALYIPLVAMLLALGMRGVSFEFRFQVPRRKRGWDAAFAAGSFVAAIAQGLVVGNLIAGVSVEQSRFTGSVLDVFRPLSIVFAGAIVAGHAVLGAAWLHLKGDGSMRRLAERALRRTLPIFVGLAIASCIAAVMSQPGIVRAWHSRPVVLATLCAVFLGLSGGLWKTTGSRWGAAPFQCGIAMYLAGIVGLAICFFPDIVPFRVDLWTAASPTLSHVFLLIGFGLVAPVVTKVGLFAYRVFGGKTPRRGWEAA